MSHIQPKPRKSTLPLKSSNQIDPIKDGPLSPLKQQPKPNPYQPYPQTHCQFTENEINKIQSLPDSLVSLSLFSKCIQKQDQQLQQFYENNPPELKSAMKAILQQIYDFFSETMVEKMEEMPTISRQHRPIRLSTFEANVSQKQSEVIQEILYNCGKQSKKEQLIENYNEQISLIEENLNRLVYSEDQLRLEQIEKKEMTQFQNFLTEEKQELKQVTYLMIACIEKQKNQKRRKWNQQRHDEMKLNIQLRKKLKRKGYSGLEDVF